MSHHMNLSSRPHVPPSRARRARALSVESVESLESRTLLNGGSLLATLRSGHTLIAEVAHLAKTPTTTSPVTAPATTTPKPVTANVMPTTPPATAKSQSTTPPTPMPTPPSTTSTPTTQGGYWANLANQASSFMGWAAAGLNLQVLMSPQYQAHVQAIKKNAPNEVAFQSNELGQQSSQFSTNQGLQQSNNQFEEGFNTFNILTGSGSYEAPGRTK